MNLEQHMRYCEEKINLDVKKMVSSIALKGIIRDVVRSTRERWLTQQTEKIKIEDDISMVETIIRIGYEGSNYDEAENIKWLDHY